MPTKSVHKWMSNEMERLSIKFGRYKPSCNGYNRIQPVLLSRSVTQMLNNPLPVEEQIGTTITAGQQYQQQQLQQQKQQQPLQQEQGLVRAKGVLSRPDSEWEEVYPTVQFTKINLCANDGKIKEKKFVHYRSCSTRIS